MANIQVNNLTFSYDNHGDNIFENASFNLDTDWKLGFVARNGRGKTTFFNLLMGKYEYGGTIKSNVRFQYFPVPVPYDKEELTAMELMEEAFPDREFWMVCRELTLLSMDADILYRQYRTLSYGERTRVMLGWLFAGDNQFLLLDEPTNHLDSDSKETVKDYLRRKKGFILVSHDRDVLDACIDHVLVINKCSIEVYQGNFTSWYENKERQDRYETEKNESLKRDINRLSSAAANVKAWADHAESTKIGFDPVKEHDRFISTRSYIGEKSRKMQARRKDIEGRINREIDEKKGLLKNIEEVRDLKLYCETFHKNVLIRAGKLAFGYEGRTICDNIDFEVKNGDRLALCGGNGSGKSTLLKLIMNELISETKESDEDDMAGKAEIFAGELSVCKGMKVSYVAQSAKNLKGTLEDYAKEHNLDYSIFLAVLRQLDFGREQFDKRIEDYSEGQKKKVSIAGSLCERAHLYIWDEPFNYIDVFSRMQIEKLILTFKPTMIIVEHDSTFIEKVSTEKIFLKPNNFCG